MDDDWRLTDSALTEEVDSLETLWVSDAGLTADSEDVVEMVDTDVTVDMDAEGCDAGEALADTDGLSVGDISVNSIDEEAGCYSAENRDIRQRQEKLQIKEDETGDCTADDLTESLTDEPGLLSNENMKDTDQKQIFLTDGEEKEEESAPDCGITCNILKFRCGHNVKEKGENLQNISFYDFIPEDQKQIERHIAMVDDPGENVFPFHKRTTEMRSSSRSHRINNNVAEIGVQFIQRPYMSGFGQPALSSSPMLSSIRHKSYGKPHYLSLYPRSLSMEGHDMPLGVYSYMDGSPRQGGAICSSGSFSQCSPLLSSGLSTPTSVVDIPPPFELAYITKRPITKSSPSLLIEGDLSEKNRKKKSSIKRFLMLKFRRKTESKPVVDVNPSLFKSSAESNHHTPSRLLDLDRRSISSSPQLNSHSVSKPHFSSEPPSTFLLYQESKRKGSSVAFLNRSVVRVESFEDRSRVPFTPLPLTKPRSISFPNADTSEYENVPAISSDYENLQVPQQRPIRQAPFTDYFDRPSRALSPANDTDGYVDMSSLPGFKGKTQSPEQETESAYTEAYNVCSVAVSPQTVSVGDVDGETAGEEDQGRTSEEEEGGADSIYERQVSSDKCVLNCDFREAVGAAVGDEGEPVLDEERLREILNELPDVYTLHRRILTELENRIRHWEESQRIADIYLSRKAEFLVFTTYIGHYDRSMSLLEDSCRSSPAFAAIVHQFEQNPAGEKVSLKHQLLQVIVRVAQYRMLLTDYLNNLSPDSKEYEDTQAAVAVISDIADQANDSIKHGENLLRLVNIEYSVRGQRDLLQPGRVFVKEGTLMKMNDVLLYTYPQQDGKYRLKNTLPLTGLKVNKPIMEDVQNALRIEGTDISITLSARWVTVRCPARDRLRLTLGEKAPTLVPVSQVMMCMNCTSDFSLTLRRHHCHGCGRIVCRSCSRNRYPLKYMKDRMAKVCDHCYNELKKRGADVSALSGKSSPRPNRSSRPLSAVFQNIHPPNIWRHRKVPSCSYFVQVTVSEEGSISGTLQRSKKSKRNWKRLWFLLRDKVLYTYRAQEEKVASESLPLLGFTVKLPDKQLGEEESNIFQLYHKNTLYYSFKAEDNYTAQRWVNAMEEATVL
uniref:FYVE, RhoGEF and PH domain containing 5 n=1 Tax=Sander lucioperca TaxID=283035 RepID=A0A8C9YXR0_SANLU